MKAWRLERDRHLATAKSGEGARLVGGRWNSPGAPVVYASAHLSLSILEILVHARTAEQRQSRRSKSELELPDELVEVLGVPLPSDFSPRTPYALTQALGDDWLRSRRSPVLAVPSALVREERCLLLNPSHPRYAECRWGAFSSIDLDPRLWTA